MSTDGFVHQAGPEQPGKAASADPCILVLFGAAGDLTKRLLMPALYNMACDGLLPKQFALVAVARAEMTQDQFRDRFTTDIRTFSTRKTFDEAAWQALVSRLYYLKGDFNDSGAYARLKTLLEQLDGQHATRGNALFYLATMPSVFGLISHELAKVGLNKRDKGWSRLIVEKPFGHDLPSAVALNRELLADWTEDQIYRIDHYLGKETVQNLLLFRFSNSIFESLWNSNHVDHIQFTVAETVGVEGRGKYYEGIGVLRDMIQNHMFQMLAYLCMEPPASFKPTAIRDEKSKLLDAVHIMTPDEVRTNTVRGQYGPGKKADGSPAAGYRQEPNVAPDSPTETYAALKLGIDNWRWKGVPIYLRSGKSMWKRGTEIVVQFRKAPEVIFRDTPTIPDLQSNQLIFHIQPDQGIEFRFHAKAPGPALVLRDVSMRFDYREAFEASRGTGYETLLYNAMIGNAMLFSRTDLVETAWRIAQPILDTWASTPPANFPNYPAGSWGPKEAFDLLARDGRRWVEVLNRPGLERVPLFKDGDPVVLHNLAMMLKPVVVAPGDYIVRKDEVGQEMYFICRGQAEALDAAGKRLRTVGEGDFFGEIALLISRARTASVRAVTPCDLLVLTKADFDKVLGSHPQYSKVLHEVAQTRYRESGTGQTA
jgi:glucose-6-phosphate 1-dehydrogenase